MRAFASTTRTSDRKPADLFTRAPAIEKNAVSAVASSAYPIRRKASCACGGGCPNCQAKSGDLKVSQPNDAAEIEADHIADKVMRMPEGRTALVKSDAPAPGIHRKCRQCEDEGPVLRKAGESLDDPVGSGTLTHVDDAISSGGQALDRQTRAFFEPRFGHDFSHVRIHTGSTAARSAKYINASAYTVGSNIVFGQDRYRPQSETGKALLAHELAHTIQQNKKVHRQVDMDAGIPAPRDAGVPIPAGVPAPVDAGVREELPAAGPRTGQTPGVSGTAFPSCTGAQSTTLAADHSRALQMLDTAIGKLSSYDGAAARSL